MTARATLLGRDPIWLIEIDIGGQIVRAATEQVEVTSAAGLALLFPAGLDEPDESQEEVAITLSGGPDWAALRARGVWLERSRAVLRRWYDGQALETAEIVSDGELVEVEYGTRTEPLVATLGERNCIG